MHAVQASIFIAAFQTYMYALNGMPLHAEGQPASLHAGRVCVNSFDISLPAVPANKLAVAAARIARLSKQARSALVSRLAAPQRGSQSSCVRSPCFCSWRASATAWSLAHTGMTILLWHLSGALGLCSPPCGRGRSRQA